MTKTTTRKYNIPDFSKSRFSSRPVMKTIPFISANCRKLLTVWPGRPDTLQGGRGMMGGGSSSALTCRRPPASNGVCVGGRANLVHGSSHTAASVHTGISADGATWPAALLAWLGVRLWPVLQPGVIRRMWIAGSRARVGRGIGGGDGGGLMSGRWPAPSGAAAGSPDDVMVSAGMDIRPWRLPSVNERR